MLRFLLSISLILLFLTVKSGTFTSKGDGITASWSGGAATWVIVGDADGIPDANDDVTILATETITWNVNIFCNNLIVNGTLQHTGSTKTLKVFGNYSLTGTESGNGTFSFNGPSTGTIDGAGTFGSSTRWTFATGRTINANVVVTKSYGLKFYAGADVLNLGTVTLNASTTEFALGSVWTNGTNSTLTIKGTNIMANGTLDASSFTNTIRTQFPFLTNLPATLGNTFSNLTILSGGTTLLGANTIVNNTFLLSNNATFSTNGFDLTCNGDFTRSTSVTLTLTPNNSVIMGGSSAQTISTPVGTTTAFQNLMINNSFGGVNFTTGTYTVAQSLTLQNGNLTIPASISVTLLSDITSTAVIGNSTSGTITGNLIAQRFIDARAAGYSDMSGCMVGQTIADWDDDLLMIFAYSPPDYFPSVYGYDETSWDYVPITSSGQTLDAGVGFEVYLDSDGLQTTFNATTIDNTGTPFIGNLDMSGYVTFNNDGWNLIGNPYHANLDYDLLSMSTLDIASDILVFDEVAEDFVTVSSGGGELIAPNQGFWVNVTGPSPYFEFTESIKSTSNSSNFRHKKSDLFSLRLKSLDQTSFTSGTSFRFSNAPETVVKAGNLPFKKVPHPEAPSFCSKSTTGKDLKINLLNSTENTITVPMKFTVGLSGIYVIESENIESVIGEGYTCVTLYDNVLSKMVNLSNENYQFSAEKGEADNRFTLVLSKDGGCQKAETVQINSSEVDIKRIGDNTLVKLSFENETSVSISVIDLLGQKITPTQVLIASVQDVYIPLPTDFSGVYLVTATYNNKTESQKLYK